eukprot:TRINITY_DN102990_c0_g1_i1.p1 TRINITY_DN102990_c0_g1~~TRINITY_DN102990_c0_g1_i1.p1  ORF type:complete len:318 (-),score=38.46 TRINITY_DN102990_c0_g1_i1:307-1260(-)
MQSLHSSCQAPGTFHWHTSVLEGNAARLMHEAVYKGQSVVDTARYPIDRRGSDDYRALVAAARASLTSEGCCRLPGFITRVGVEKMQAECQALQHGVRRNQNGRRVNVYYSETDATMPSTHPLNHEFDRHFGVIRDDMIAPNACVRSVYDDERVLGFAADVVGVRKLYQSRDAYQALTVNVMGDGENLHWHFDCNACAITLGIQQPHAGGELEYIPNIGRENYDEVEKTIAAREGETPANSKAYHTEEGALIFFRGGQSMHRVKPVLGERLRFVAALQLHTSDDAVDTPDMTERIYGVLQKEHLGPKKTVVAGEASM